MASKYLEHVAKQAWVQRDIRQKGIPLKVNGTDKEIIIGTNSMVREMGSRLVCPKCERLAFGKWEEGEKPKAKCPSCGWHGEGITFDEYIAVRLYN